MNHFANNGKEYLKMREENNKFRQGRSKEQMKGSYMGAFFSIIGIVILLLVLALT